MLNQNLNQQELRNILINIIESKICPYCYAPLINYKGVKSKNRRKDNDSTITCIYCLEELKLSYLDAYYARERKIRPSNIISYEKIKEISYYHLKNVTMSSKFDIKFDSNRFVQRKEANLEIKRFINANNNQKKIFLILGQPGFGKTWFVANIANNLLKNDYPVFFLSLKDDIHYFFESTFNERFTKALRELEEAINVEKYNDDSIEIKPIIFILDGFDEINSFEDEIFLVNNIILGYLSRMDNVLVILTSRPFSWLDSASLLDYRSELNTKIWLTDNELKNNQSALDEINISLELNQFNPEELDIVLNRYNLPTNLDLYEEEIRNLVSFPIWTRLISEWHSKYDSLPHFYSIELLNNFLRRIGLFPKDLGDLSEIWEILMRKQDLIAEIKESELKNTKLDKLNHFSQKGIFNCFYNKMGEKIWRISLKLYAWYGVAVFLYYQKLNEIRLQDKSTIGEFQEKLFQSYRLKFQDQLHIHQLLHYLFDYDEEYRYDDFKYVNISDTDIIQRDYKIILSIQNTIRKNTNIDSFALNPIHNISENSTGYMVKDGYVVALSISNEKLYNFPLDVVNLSGLQILIINNCSLSRLPDDINRIQLLKRIYLQNNSLYAIPDSLGSIRWLNRLYLDNNNIENLPPTLNNLSALEILSIENNKITVSDPVYLEIMKKIEERTNL